jgi:hypothetical protein
MGLRLILGDYLEEQGDPRCGLVRLVPKLLALPDKVGPHPDLPYKVWIAYDKGDQNKPAYRDSRKEWPRLGLPSPQGRSLDTGYMERYRGLHNLGRLLLGVLRLEGLRLYGTSLCIEHFRLVRPWAYNCRLIGPKERDKSVVSLFLECEFLERSGVFGNYIHFAEGYAIRMARPAGPFYTDKPYSDYRQAQLQNQAAVYGRFLDLYNEFVRICPWQAAHDAWQQARKPQKLPTRMTEPFASLGYKGLWKKVVGE